MEANAGESFQMQMLFNIFPRISLHCKLVPVQFWEYEYGLLHVAENKARENVHGRATIGFGFTSDWLKNLARELWTNHVTE